jgi:hypothetical protein
MTAALFMLSAVAHHVMAAGMITDSGVTLQSRVAETAGQDMPAHHGMAADGMATHDTDAPCPMSSDCSSDMDMRAMACSVHCATVIGVLAEPVLVLVTTIAHRLDRPLGHALASLHGPPDSPPPKSSTLI